MGCACVSVWPDKYLCSLVQSKMSGLLLLSSRDDEALMRSFVSICCLVLLVNLMYLLVGRFVCRIICLTNCPQICFFGFVVSHKLAKMYNFCISPAYKSLLSSTTVSSCVLSL